MRNRKSKSIEERNLGVPNREQPPLSSSHDATTMIERLLLKILRESIDKLSKSESECRRFFSHFFDGSTPEDSESFVTNFMRQPPLAVLGYARSTADFPCIAIVLENDSPTENFLGDFVGQTREDDDEEPTEYVGAIFETTHAMYIYAEHPDVCNYLYQFTKAVAISGVEELLSRNVQDVSLSGGELTPDENYMPNNMFVRVLRVTATAPFTVPRLLTTDPSKVRVTGIFADDVVVDGVRGGVTATTEVQDE